MKHAALMLRAVKHYRREVFSQGLARLGYEVTDRAKSRPEATDVLVLWNRTPPFEPIAQRYEKAGARVVVAENGYIGSSIGGRLFALALGHHNGAGAWPVGDAARFATMGIDLRPWRKDGDFILVLAQRGIGEKGVAMPMGWPLQAQQALARATRRPIRVRAHPGPGDPRNHEPDEALRGAWAAVTWGSGAGLKAIAQGVPVFYGLGWWIGGPGACRFDAADFERPLMDYGLRQRMFQRLAWAQWTETEIASGEGFAWLGL